MRREPVDSSLTNLSRNAPRPSSSTRSSTVNATSSSDSRIAGVASRADDVVAHVDVPLEAERDVLRDGERREDAGVLERPAEADGRPAVGAPRDDVDAAEADRAAVLRRGGR